VGGEQIDVVTSKWIGTVSPSLRGALEKIGLLDASRVAALRPLMEHIEGTDDEPGWKQYLVAKGNTMKHVDNFVERVRKAVRGTKAKFWSDLSATKIMTWLNEQRRDTVDGEGTTIKRGIGAYAFNGFVTALGGFARWMQREGRATDNPMLGLRKLNPRTDKRHPRRPFTVEEVRWLLAVTRKGPVRRKMTGVERAMLYRLAVETGYRSSELASLTRASFVLDGERPSVSVQAGYSKHRRDDVLPLRADTAAELRDFLAGKLSTAKAFNMPRDDDVAKKLLRPDLDEARAAWITDAGTAQERAERVERAAMGFLCYVDAQGRYADFHSLRHTTSTLLVASGVHPKVTQSIMRHSTIELTMGVYSHVLAGQEVDAIAALPSLVTPPVKDSPPFEQKSLPISLPVDQRKLGRQVGAKREGNFAVEDVKNCENITENNKNHSLHETGLEPVTCGSEDRCSIQLSYSCNQTTVRS